MLYCENRFIWRIKYYFAQSPILEDGKSVANFNAFSLPFLLHYYSNDLKPIYTPIVYYSKSNDMNRFVTVEAPRFSFTMPGSISSSMFFVLGNASNSL